MFRVLSAALLAIAAVACTPPAPAPGADAAAASATPAESIAPATPETGPAAPNTAETLSATPPAPAPMAATPAVQPPPSGAPATAPPPAAPPTTTASAPDATPAEIANGRTAYARTCAMCHGPKGEGTAAAAAIATRDPATIANKITKGAINPGERMPPMGGMLSADEIDDVSKFVASGLPQ